jgi:hypothetical protein
MTLYNVDGITVRGLWIETDFEGSDNSLIEELTQYFRVWTEGNHARCPMNITGFQLKIRRG